MEQLKLIKCYALMFTLIIFSYGASATNVQVSNVTQVAIDANHHRVTFDLSWEDSWRKDTQEPNNYDGVWVFLKYRDCLEKASGNPGSYNHAWLADDTTQHTYASATIGGNPFVMVKEPGYTNIGGNDRVMGLFLHQPAGDRVGDVSMSTISLLWEAGLQGEDASLTTFDVQVVAIEMVYIPQDSFYLGDGTSLRTFRDLENSNQPVYVNSASMDFLAESGNYYGNLRPNNAAPNIDNSFPNGFEAFWIMKYEISQEQYVQYLNSLSRIAQQNRIETTIDGATSTVSNNYVLSNSNSMVNRNGVVCPTTIPVGGEPIVFHNNYNGNPVFDENGDGGNIACNFLGIHDVLSYLDWAALRPLTEFEFEKAARGPHKRPYGYTLQKPWGIAQITEVTGIDNAGFPNETYSNTGNVTGICNWNNNTSVNGPMRCGFAAKPTTTNRYDAGASYYGVFELGGNVGESYWSLHRGTTYDDGFGGESGDGLLNNDGNADVATWPQGVTGTGTADDYFFFRGGYWNHDQETYLMTISGRWENENEVNNENNYTGGRGGRFTNK